MPRTTDRRTGATRARAREACAGPPVAATRRALLGWFETSGRDLPWRTRRTAWRVWVSEVMLQQTRVEAVVEPYRRFLARFPSLASVARAREEDVLAAWSGLGYYRRAKRLHAGARHVERHCGGRVPRTRAALEDVPGIGAYTAGAILSIAFGQREVAVDANVARVLARLHAIGDASSARGRSEVAVAAAALVDCERPGDVNEALMDLGSALCTAREARCGLCPLSHLCAARAGGDPLAIGGPRVRPQPRRVDLACAVVRDGPRVLFVRRADDDALLGGLWDLPTVECAEGDEDAGELLREFVRSRAGYDVRLGKPLARVRHDIVGRKILATVYAASRPRGGRLPRDARMLSSADARRVALPALPVKILRELQRLGQPRWS